MLVTPEFKFVDPSMFMILQVIGVDNPTPQPYKDWTGVYVIPHFSLDHMIRLPGSDRIGDEPSQYDYTYPEFPEAYHKAVPPTPQGPWDAEDDEAEHGFFNCYGVCDTPDAFLARFGELLKADERKFAMSFTHIDKKSQSPEGGWRWHKWGPYIGEGRPTTEYIYDEDAFDDGVYCYHIYQVGGDLWLSEMTKRIKAAVKERDAKGD